MAKETQCQITHFGAVPDKTYRLSVATECTIRLINLCFKLQLLDILLFITLVWLSTNSSLTSIHCTRF